MSLRRSLKQRIENSAPYPKIRILPYTHPFCYLICGPKADSLHVIRQTVGVFLYHTINLLAVLSVNLHGQIYGNAVLLKKYHSLAKLPLFFKLLTDLPGLPLADTLDLRQTLRFPFQDGEGIFSETAYNAGRQCCANPLNRTASQIPFYSGYIPGGFYLKAFRLKLLSIEGMLNIITCQLQKLSLADIMEASHHRDLLSLRHQTQNGISVFFISINNVLYIAFQFHMAPKKGQDGLNRHAPSFLLVSFS